MQELVCDRLMASKEIADQTLAERADQGKRARAAVPRSVHGGWVPSPGPGRPRGPAAGAGRHAGARAGADQVRPDAGLAVHVLPRRRLPDGVRPGRHPTDQHVGAAVRRRAPVELRGLRGPGPAARLQHQRLRRDAARPVRVGRQAAGDELRRRGPRPRVRRRAAGVGQPGGGPGVPAVDGGLRGDAHDGGVDLAPGHRRDRAALGVPDGQAGPEAVRPERRQGPRQGQRAGLQEARHPRRRTTPAHRGSPADRAARGPAPRPRVPPGLGGVPRPAPLLPAQPPGRPPAPARPLPLPGCRPQGGRRGQRRHPRVGRR